MKLDEFLNNNVVLDDEYLKQKINSEQFKLARRIMELENKYESSQESTAETLNISLEKLLNYESADTSLPISEYKMLIKRLENAHGIYQFSNSDNDINRGYVQATDDNTFSGTLKNLNVLFHGNYRLSGERA